MARFSYNQPPRLTIETFCVLREDPVFDIYNENFYYFELLFCFEELNVSSNDSTGVSDQLWSKVSLFGSIVIVSEQICALKQVLAGWAEDLALPLP